MAFTADFHVHSCYSRATARNMDIENLYISAQLKGITVIGTGDFTHPGWFSELKEKLVFCENGLFKLKPDIAGVCDEKVPLLCRSPVFFMLTTEISNIYKKKGKTRKNHNLIFVPDFHAASHFSSKLSSMGNLESDGRPILGLDAKNLLDILLETTDRGFFVPAHIWTPWFSLLLDVQVFFVIPVKTGIQGLLRASWIPGLRSAAPGMTGISSCSAKKNLNIEC